MSKTLSLNVEGIPISYGNVSWLAFEDMWVSGSFVGLWWIQGRVQFVGRLPSQVSQHARDFVTQSFYDDRSRVMAIPNQRHVIACRTLQSGDSEVLIEIYEPVEVNQMEWRCDFSVHGMSTSGPQMAFGIDSIQAILSAIDGIRLYLSGANESVSWLGQNSEIGLPRSIPTSLGFEFYQKLCGIIDDEVERQVEALRTRRT